MNLAVIGAGGWGTTLANLLAEKGYNGLPEISVQPVSFAKITENLRSIINEERSKAHRFAEDALFFKETLPGNWLRRYAGKAGKYVFELKKCIKKLSQYETAVPGIRETKGWLGTQEHDLHTYVLRFFDVFGRLIVSLRILCVKEIRKCVYVFSTVTR